jgi:hypothetical protein
VTAESTLALFQARVFLVDDVDTALATDDLAVRSAAFDGSANSHVLSRKKDGLRRGTWRQKRLHAIKRKGERLSKGNGMASALLNFFRRRVAPSSFRPTLVQWPATY